MSGLTRGMVQTVLGPVAPEDLGQALMHEHVFIDLNPPALRDDAPHEGISDAEIDLCTCFRARVGQHYSRPNMRLTDFAILKAELLEMKRAGGQTLVDLTVGGLGPQPDRLRWMAQETGLHIVMGSGHYVSEYHLPEVAGKTPDDFAAQIIGQLTRGAWGSDVQAGIIGEIGCQSPWQPIEQAVMTGALIAMQETGAALNVHPGRHQDQPQEVAEFAAGRGARMDRVILSHIDRTIFDHDTLFRLADTGVVIEYDLFGWEESYYFPNPAIDMPNDGARLKWLRALIDRGHLDQILISHDICTKVRLERFGGHGYQHIFANVLPLMRRRGFSESEIRRIMIDTPRRLLTIA
jgi:Predicted metal-dependent hydrolase with the TIM-barrel fold